MTAVGEDSATKVNFDREQSSANGEKSGKKPKFLCVIVEGKDGSQRRHKNVNIKIPLMLIKAGVKIGSIVPDHARDKVNRALGEHGMDVDIKKIDDETLDEILKALQTTEIMVDEENEKIRICCE